MRKINIVSLSLVLWFLLSLGIPFAVYSSDHRLNVVIFKYSGPAEGFEQFYGTVKDKIQNMHLYLDKKNIKNNYLELLSVSKPLKDTIANAKKLHIFWKDQKALEIMRGGVWIESGKNFYTATSRIYFGDLGEKCNCLPKSNITVEMPVSKNEFGSTLDTHSLVTIIILVLDALNVIESKQQGEPEQVRELKQVVTALLAEAEDKLFQLKNKSKLSNENVALFEDAIRNARKCIK